MGKVFQKNCYNTIFRKVNTEETILPFTVITKKTILFFKKKAQFAKIYCCGRPLYVIYIYGHGRLDILSGANRETILVNIVYLLVKV